MRGASVDVHMGRVRRGDLERLREVQPRAHHLLFTGARLEKPRERLGLRVGRGERLRRAPVCVQIVRVQSANESRQGVALWTRHNSTCSRL